MNDDDKEILENVLYCLSGLTLFRGIRQEPFVKELYDFLLFFSPRNDTEPPTAVEKAKKTSAYSQLFSMLQAKTEDPVPNLTSFLFQMLYVDDNLLSRTAVKRGSSLNAISPDLFSLAQKELTELRDLFSLRSEIFTETIHEETGHTLPNWKTSQMQGSPDEELALLFSRYQKDGFGLFSLYHTFIWKNHKLEPVKKPDPILRHQLFSYAYEIGRIEENTKKLTLGKIAENLLLFGARGTGKSSTVKAMANTYCQNGLRLIEIGKDDLLTITDLLEYISEFSDTRFSFILFLDDLSFAEDDSRYTAVKTLLEGGVKTRPKNTAIYATSNRRHIVAEKKESDLYANDSRNERLSLSDRFGIAIRFAMPTQEEYLSIVRGILEDRKIPFDEDEVAKNARLWAMQENGFSPRTARQFCDSMDS